MQVSIGSDEEDALEKTEENDDEEEDVLDGVVTDDADERTDDGVELGVVAVDEGGPHTQVIPSGLAGSV